MAAEGNYIVGSDVDNWADAVSSTEEFATTDVKTETDRIAVVNDIATASLIRFSSTAALPSPLVAGTAYYAIKIDSETIEVATTPVKAAAEEAIDITDVGSGTHTLDVGEGSSEADRQTIIDRVEDLIEQITKDFFYAKSFVIYLDGNDNDRLFLGLLPDVLTVTEILVFGVELSSSWWTYNNRSIYLDPEAVSGDPELRLRLKYEQRLFPKGMGNIKVTGTHGWAVCPAAIKQAAIILCRAENDETLYTKYDDLVTDKMGDASYGRGSKIFLTGIHEADKLLRNHIRKKPMMSVI